MLEWLNSLSVLNQTALISLLALLIPVLIHLINPNKGKLIWVGNLELLKKISRSQVTQLKIKQWILLFLRMLMFLLAGLLMANLTGNKRTENLPDVKIMTPQWLSAVPEETFNDVVNNHQDHQVFLLGDELQKIEKGASFQALLERAAKSDDVKKQSVANVIEFATSLNLPAKKIEVYLENSLSPETGLPQLNQVAEKVIFAASKDKNQGQLNILIFSSLDRKADGKIVEGALLTLRSALKLQWKISLVENLAQLQSMTQSNPGAGQFDMIFELSPKNEGLESYIRNGGVLFKDSDQNVQSINSAYANIELQNTRFDKISKVKDTNYRQIWRTSTGDELLSVDIKSEYTQLNFYSRFNPDYTKLVEKQQFPFILLNLLNNHLVSDSWQVANTEFQPKTLAEEKSNHWYSARESLYDWILFLLVLLWLSERFLAEGLFSARLSQTGLNENE